MEVLMTRVARVFSLAALATLAMVPATAEASGSKQPAVNVQQAAGTSAAAIQSAVDAYRNDLGTLNPNVPGSFGSGRREINWDGVPDAFSAPNNLPANFFNSNSPRGVIFATPGTAFQVSANAVNPTGTPVRFGDINAEYPTDFQTFSLQRLFSPLGSNITDITFFL